MTERGKVVSIGEAAQRVVAQVEAKMLGSDFCEGPRLWGALRAAAHEAKRWGVRISLVPQGFLVQARNKSEIVRWEEVDVGLLHSAVERVSPRTEIVE